MTPRLSPLLMRALGQTGDRKAARLFETPIEYDIIVKMIYFLPP